MSTKENLLVVIDPTRDEHPALERAIITAKMRDSAPEIHIFIGVDGHSVDTSHRNPDMYSDVANFSALSKRMEKEGLEYTAEICWAHDWQKALLSSGKHFQTDMIVIPDYGDSEKGIRFSDSKWALLRNAKCPVLIVRPGAEYHRKTVLAAINAQAKDERYQELNDKIVSRGKWSAELYGADLHVVNAYTDTMNIPDRGSLLRKLGMDSDHVHIRQGAPEDVISEAAKELDADIVLIGTLARKGLLAAMRGNTSERVLTQLEMDVMALN
ncbi:MAG: universal stress protein [Cellvibrionaceae bacterium]|nr:universal stress protein [Cellvibrionaceae bacterium]